MTLIVLDESGGLLGELPAFDVSLPYWPETAEIVAAARERYGLDLAVLRLLKAPGDVAEGGHVTYLGQLLSPAAGAPWTPTEVDLSHHPLRAPYAHAGGPARSLAWAARALDERGRGPVTAAIQQRTWNLSTLWRLDTPTGPYWLKQVPDFFAHEPVVLTWAAGSGRATPLLVAEDARMLLAHVDGDDLYGAGVEVRRDIAADLHYLQVAAIDSVPHLLADGVPDRRRPRLEGYLRGVIEEYGGGDVSLRALAAGLPDRLDRIEACRLPDTLVHGDLHPGNVIGGDRRTIIDWGDSFIGHPGFDVLRLTEVMPAGEAEVVIEDWAARWRAEIPGSDPHGALELLRPVAALRMAAVYADFLAGIEPAEHPYHAGDVATWLRRAVELYEEER
ncbi:aminoglycoside phosphotransferase family protein [Luedemannella helvata]|uniref:phosphotransferase family protein n=1 Tax=Luedemannella helvata TaxID=349315 RepID=UPI0031D6D87B